MSKKCDKCGRLTSVYHKCQKCGAYACSNPDCQKKQFGRPVSVGTCPLCKGQIKNETVK